MDLESYMKVIENTEKDDWVTIDGQVFLNPGSDGETHTQLATLRSDMSISIATGLSHLKEFKEKWTNNNPNPSASSDYIDFLWNGRPVVRKLGVWVDGGRGLLPVPSLDDLSVSHREVSIFRLLNELFGSKQFARYMASAKLTPVSRAWP